LEVVLVMPSVASSVVDQVLLWKHNHSKVLLLLQDSRNRVTGGQKAVRLMLSSLPSAWMRTMEICKSVDGTWSS
jgi:hypothetical protein